MGRTETSLALCTSKHLCHCRSDGPLTLVHRARESQFLPGGFPALGSGVFKLVPVDVGDTNAFRKMNEHLGPARAAWKDWNGLRYVSTEWLSNWVCSHQTNSADNQLIVAEKMLAIRIWHRRVT